MRVFGAHCGASGALALTIVSATNNGTIMLRRLSALSASQLVMFERWATTRGKRRREHLGRRLRRELLEARQRITHV